MNKHVTTVPTSGFRISLSEGEKLVGDLPLLIAGLLQRLEFVTSDGRPMEIGRFAIRTLWGEPMFYIAFSETRRAVTVDAAFLQNMANRVASPVEPVVPSSMETMSELARNANRAIPPENDPDVLFGMDAMKELVRNVPLLLSGAIGGFELETDDGRTVRYGRSGILSLGGEPILFFAFKTTGCGTTVDAGYLRSLVAETSACLREAETGPPAGQPAGPAIH